MEVQLLVFEITVGHSPGKLGKVGTFESGWEKNHGKCVLA